MEIIAKENKFGHIQIIKNNETILYLQYELEIENFYNSLDNNEIDLISNGYIIDITDSEILTDYIDANILEL
tara:strand:+ start:380 stop:595 length:216 start_codon:yes stop_codon:yes gene_type:complete